MEHVEIIATEAGQFENDLRPTMGDVSVRPCKGSQFEARARLHKLNRIILFTVHSPSINVQLLAPRTTVRVNVPIGRPFSVREEDHHREISDGGAHLTRGDEPFEAHAKSDCRVLVATMSEVDIEVSAARLNQSESPMLPRLNHIIDLRNPEGNPLFRRLVEVWGLLNRSAPVIEASVGIQELEDRYLTSLILSATSYPVPLCQTAAANALSRVEEFLAANLAQPVSRAEIAEIACVSIRSLSRGFVKRHGVGPMTFLRQRRLEAAYRELLGGDEGIINVTDVAMKFGFNHLGKFASVYRQMFGECPSQTLRK